MLYGIIPPFPVRLKWKNNAIRRGRPSSITSKQKQCNREEQVPSLLHKNENNATERGHTPTMLKWKQPDEKGGMPLPCCVKMRRTQQGRACPFSLPQNGNNMTERGCTIVIKEI